jgi:uncharacterized protein
MARAFGVAIRELGRKAGPLIGAATLLLASFAASAQRVEGDRAEAEGVYAAEINVNGQGEAERNVAFARGMAQVLAKMTGDRGVTSLPGVSQELRQAKDYIDGYDYRQDEGLSPSGAPSFKTTLVLRYDPEEIDGLVSALGLPVWPQPRPKPVLWLAIDDGSGPRLVGLAKAAVARSTLDRAIERGYALGLPSGNAAEQAVVGAIWRGDSAAVARASKRYSPPMQLIGKLYRSADGWTADWIFVDKGKVLSRWSESGASARQMLATGADGAADALMKRYAKRDRDAGLPGTYPVLFTGIDSADDYIRLSGYLQKLAVVRKVTPVRATPQGVQFDLELISGLPGFKRLVAGDDVLLSIEGGPLSTEGEPPVYRMR